MQELNIDPNMIPHWVTLCKRLDAGELDPEQIVRAAAKLISIEERTGKTYDEIIDEYSSKDTELAEIKQTLKTLTEKKNALEEQIKKASARYRIEQDKLAKTVNDRECLRRVGIEKIVNFSRLIEAGEKLGYRPEKIKEAEEFHKQLTDIGINPSQLKKFIKEKGKLNTQLTNLRREIEKHKRTVSHLREEEMDISRWIEHMRELRMILQDRLVPIACKHCLRSIHVFIRSKRTLTDAMRKGAFLTIACSFCGVPNHIAPQTVLQAVGWMVLDW
jgi:flagellar biosynthesis chaperone FliJ